MTFLYNQEIYSIILLLVLTKISRNISCGRYYLSSVFLECTNVQIEQLSQAPEPGEQQGFPCLSNRYFFYIVIKYSQNIENRVIKNLDMSGIVLMFTFQITCPQIPLLIDDKTADWSRRNKYHMRAACLYSLPIDISNFFRIPTLFQHPNPSFFKRQTEGHSQMLGTMKETRHALVQVTSP